MKTLMFVSVVSALFLAGCSSTYDRDTSGMGSASGTTSGAATETYHNSPTGIGSSSTGQPYGAYPNTGNRPGMSGTSGSGGDSGSGSSGSGTR